ncbi:MAG TPA: lipid-A-disaccharide synthase [Burkholderiales bacterium]|nr:lipid-A-disaccharide synthase [Burkholderiales bacterium]
MNGAPVRIAMVAGEASGDLLGSRVIAALKARYPHAEFYGIGGPKMIGKGFDSWFPQERLAVHGLVEVLKHLRGLMAIRRELVRRIAASRPHLFLGIDSPDFNLGLAKRLRKRGVTTAHLVSPTVWAWRKGRIKTIREAVSHMLVLLPFEEAIYQDAGVPVSFVGHPLADEIPDTIDRGALLEYLRLPAKSTVITLLPGSRQQEVMNHAEPFIGAAKLIRQRLGNVQFLVPCATRETYELFEQALYQHGEHDLPVRMMFGHAQEALAASDLAIAASGTVTLEAALLRCPMIIAYRMSPMSFAIAKRIIRVKHVGLPNILCDDRVVPEFLQDDVTPENLAQAALNLYEDKRVLLAIRERFAAVHAVMKRGAAERSAEALAPLIERSLAGGAA